MIEVADKNIELNIGMTKHYERSFSEYCQSGREGALMAAYNLAREALESGFTLADFGAVHHGALRQMLCGTSGNPAWIDRAEDFYLEGIAVFDMAIRGYQTNVASLQKEVEQRSQAENELREVSLKLAQQRDQLDQTVRRRTKELALRADELQLANRQLKHTNREQAAFTYGLSHDLKTPINTLDMFLNTLLEDYKDDLDQDALELISIASATAERMKDLIDAVLEYSRIVEDEHQYEDVDMAQIAVDVIRDAAALIKETKAKVTCHDLPKVKGSAFQLRMFLANLLSNALRYQTPGRPPEISISARTDQQPQVAVIAVSDNGIGMPHERRDRIFELFKRFHRFDEIKGSGIGLALCKRVAENHASAISVESEPGQGSTFSISLKLAEEQWND